MHDFLKMIAEDKTGNVFVFTLFAGVLAVVFIYWFFEGAAKLVQAFRGKQ